MTSNELMNSVMAKAQTLEADQLDDFFTLMCTMSIGVLRGIHDDEFINDFLKIAMKDDLVITPQRVN